MIEQTIDIATKDGAMETFICHPDRGGLLVDEPADVILQPLRLMCLDQADDAATEGRREDGEPEQNRRLENGSRTGPAPA